MNHYFFHYEYEAYKTLLIHLTTLFRLHKEPFIHSIRISGEKFILFIT